MSFTQASCADPLRLPHLERSSCDIDPEPVVEPGVLGELEDEPLEELPEDPLDVPPVDPPVPGVTVPEEPLPTPGRAESPPGVVVPPALPDDPVPDPAPGLELAPPDEPEPPELPPDPCASVMVENASATAAARTAKFRCFMWFPFLVAADRRNLDCMRELSHVGQ